jgi:hypothetical protein
MSHWKPTFAAALLVAATGPRAAAQCISQMCDDDESTRFVSSAIIDEVTGSAPLSRTTLTLPQFDVTIYAGMHGVTPGDVSLLGVSIDFLASVDPLIQLDSGTGTACVSSWTYDTGVTIFASPTLGLPGTIVTTSDAGLADLPGSNGGPPPWDYTSNPPASMDAYCFAGLDDLEPWMGTGQIDLDIDSYASFSTSGCATIVTGFENTAVVRASLRWVYCVVGGGGPGGPGTAYCFGDGSGTACPCDNDSAVGAGQGCANSLGVGAAMAATGTNSVGADDIVFTTVNMRPNQPALVFVGENAVNGGDGVVFGDGLRCAGGTVLRFDVMLPNAQGTANWGPGLQPTGGWSAGDTRRFQTWYRDPGGSPCGNNFNLSNGYEVSFMP